MADAIVSQAGAEVVAESIAFAKLSQAGAEVISSSFVPAKISQLGAEVITLGVRPPIDYEDPCGIERPRLHIKISTETASYRYSNTPLRESAALGGFKEHRLLKLGQVIRRSSDPLTGSWSAQRTNAVLADTDRVLRALSVARNGLRNCDIEYYLTSKARSLARQAPRVLFAGKIYDDNAGENLSMDLSANDVIGVDYSLFAEEKQLPQRVVTRTDFVNAPEDSLGLGIPIAAGLLQNKTAGGVGIFDGVYVGQLNLGGTSAPPTGTDLATIVSLLTAAGAAGTIYSDYGGRIGFDDATKLQSFYDSYGYIPADFDGLSIGTGLPPTSFTGIGVGDLNAWLGSTAVSGGGVYEVVAIACHAMSSIIVSGGNPSIWINEAQISMADMGVSVWCPQIAGDVSWASTFGADAFTDLTGSDGVTRRYTLIAFAVGSAYATAVAGGAKVHVEGVGFETNGDGTGTPILDYFSQYLHLLVNFGLQDYTSGPWLSIPRFTLPDGVTTVERVNALSFEKASEAGGVEVPGGFKGAFVVGAGGVRASIREIIANLNTSGGVLLADNDYGQLQIKKLSRDRSTFLRDVYTGREHRDLRDKLDILPGFKTESRPNWQANSVAYSYAQNYHAGKYQRQFGGDGGVEPVEDAASQAINGFIQKIFEFKMLQDDATAAAVAQHYLRLLKDTPQVAIYKRRGLCGLEDDILTGVTITHYNGRGALGYVNHAFWILAKTFDVNTATTFFEALDVEGYVPAIVAEDEALTADPVAAEDLVSDDGSSTTLTVD